MDATKGTDVSDQTNDTETEGEASPAIVTGSGRYMKCVWPDGYKLQYDWPRAMWHLWNPANFDAPNLYGTTVADLVFSLTSYSIAAVATEMFPGACMTIVAATVPETLMRMAVEEDDTLGRRQGPDAHGTQANKAASDFKKGTKTADA